MTEERKPIEQMVIVHIKKVDLFPEYLVCGDERVRLFIVDENAPDDRVYEITSRVSAEVMEQVLGDSPRGHSGDDKHHIYAHKIAKAFEGKPHVEIVK